MKPPHRRRSIRLPGYDYSQPGGYFVTVCTKDRECVFGEVAGGQVRLSPLGQIAAGCLADLPSHFQDVELDEWVVMPNHIHAILVIHGRGTACRAPTTHEPCRAPTTHEPCRAPTAREPCRAPTTREPCRAPTLNVRFGRPVSGSLPSVVGSYKAAVTKRINQLRGTPGTAGWQRNYYEHVICDEEDLRRIREYIAQNPLSWEIDEENPGRS